MICNSNVFSFTFTLVFNALTSSRTGLIQVLRGWWKQTALCVGSGRCFAIKNEYALKQSKKGDMLTRPNLFSLKGLDISAVYTLWLLPCLLSWNTDIYVWLKCEKITSMLLTRVCKRVIWEILPCQGIVIGMGIAHWNTLYLQNVAATDVT